MLSNVFWFELRYRLRSWSTWVCFAVLVLLVYRDTLSGNWDDLIASGRVARNSPYAMYFLFMYYTFWTATLGGGLVIQSILRDFQSRSADILYSYPIDSRRYFWGKYAAALIVLVLVSAAVVVGFVTLPTVATSLGIKPPMDFTPVSWPHIASGFLLLTVPSCFFFGTVFFALAAVSARPGPAYTAIVVFVGLFMAIGVTFGEGTPFALMQILDPFGKQTLEGQLLYWTAQERATGFLRLEGNMLWNRALYVALGAVALLICLRRFDLRRVLAQRGLRAARSQSGSDVTAAGVDQRVTEVDRVARRTSQDLSASNFLRFALSAGWHELSLTARDASFRIAYAAVLLLSIAAAWGFASFHTVSDGNLLPTTAQLLHRASIVPILMCMVGTSYYAVEMVLRERSARMSALVDVCPVPTWALLLSKTTGAVLLAALFALIPTLATTIIQLAQGFFDGRLVLLLQATLLWAAPIMIGYALVAVVCAGLVSVRGGAQAIAIMVGITPFTLQETRVLEHHLALWGVPFPVALSDFEANAQLLERAGTFALYWLALFGALWVIVYWAWPRGEGSIAQRLSAVPGRIRPASAVFAVVMIGACVLAGSRIHAIVNERNEYRNHSQLQEDRARYERALGERRSVPQPKIADAALEIEFHPAQRKLHWQAVLELDNTTAADIGQLHLEPAEHATIVSATFNGTPIEPHAAEPSLRHLVYSLPDALLPGERASLRLDGELHYSGFVNEGRLGTLAAGASYVPAQLWPQFGYQRERELDTDGARRRASLPSRVLPPAANEAGRATSMWATDDANRLAVTTKLTTDADQIALAPGELLSRTTEAGRNIFVYRSPPGQLWRPQAVSGRYQVRKDAAAADEQPVDIEIYFNAAHAYNVDRFVEAARAAVEVGSRWWEPYPFQTLRIAEVPLEAADIAASANLIVIAEDRGWTHDYRKPVPFDWITYLIGRETARIWWGERVAPAATLGSALITEGIPALHGLLALERAGGEAQMLSYVDVLTERYLRASAREEGREPAALGLDDQRYAAERAALAAYQVYSVLGHERFMSVLAAYYTQARLRSEPPFAEVRTLADSLISAANTKYERELIQEALYQTTVYDYRVRTATAYPDGVGRYALELRLEGMSYATDGSGSKQAAPAHGSVAVAVYEKDKKVPIGTWNVSLENGAATTTRVLAVLPARVEVDPRRQRIDRNQSDNQRPVRAERVPKAGRP